MPLSLPHDPGRETLRALLRQEVPWRIHALLADHAADQLAALLPVMAQRAGLLRSPAGEVLLLPTTAGQEELITGVAALVLLSGQQGAIILGDYYGPAPGCEDAQCC